MASRLTRGVLKMGFALIAGLLVAGPVSAQEPNVDQILNVLYPTSSGFTKTLLGTKAGSGALQLGDATGYELWQQMPTGGTTATFDLQVKYAGNNTTFGFFNPPSSLTSGAPATTDFNAVFTTQFSNGATYDGGGNLTAITGSVLVHSHLTGLGSNFNNGVAAPLSGAGTVLITDSQYVTPTSANGVFTVTSGVGDPIAFGIRTPASINDPLVSTSSSTQYSSASSQNWDGKRHMVTYLITKAGEDDRYVIAWEDLPSGGNPGSDWDYNDLIIEVVQKNDQGLQPQPEPTTLALLGIGFAGLCGQRIRRQLKSRRDFECKV